MNHSRSWIADAAILAAIGAGYVLFRKVFELGFLAAVAGVVLVVLWGFDRIQRNNE